MTTIIPLDVSSTTVAAKTKLDPFLAHLMTANASIHTPDTPLDCYRMHILPFVDAVKCVFDQKCQTVDIVSDFYSGALPDIPIRTANESLIKSSLLFDTFTWQSTYEGGPHCGTLTQITRLSSSIFGCPTTI